MSSRFRLCQQRAEGGQHVRDFARRGVCCCGMRQHRGHQHQRFRCVFVAGGDHIRELQPRRRPLQHHVQHRRRWRPYTIAPATELPPLTCIGTVIDGYSQPGAAVNTTVVDPASLAPASLTTNLQIILNGSSLSMGRGLTISADNVTVKGLAIRTFPYEGIYITGSNARIQGNFIGTDPGGMTAFGNGFAGIVCGRHWYSNRRGAAGVNLITGNVFAGIQVFDPANNFQIWSNLLGGDRAGAVRGVWGGNGAVEVYGGMPATNMVGDIYSNIIHYSAGSAVWVDPNATNVSITENSMFSRQRNQQQWAAITGLAAPVLTQVTHSATGTSVNGTFAALLPGAHRLNFFPTFAGRFRTSARSMYRASTRQHQSRA